MSFPRYAKYKASGVEWLGEVPAHWEVTRLKRIASIRYGIGEPPAYHINGVPLVRATNVHCGVMTLDGVVFVRPDDIPAQRIVWLEVGDIIVVRSGAYAGDSAIVPPGFPRSIAGFDMVLRCHSAHPAFIQSTLLSYYVKQRQIDVESARAAQPHLNAEELGACIVLLPRPEEQVAIATFLDRETAKIDALVAEQQRLIELLKEKRQAVISHAVTKGLDPTAKRKPSGIEWLGDVPAHWEVAPLASRFRVQLGKMLDTSRVTGMHLRPYLRVFDVQWGKVNVSDLPLMDFDEDDRAKFRLLTGDVLVNEGGSYPGRASVWKGDLEECYYQKALHRLRAIEGAGSSPQFLYYVFHWAVSKGVFVAGGNEATIEHLPAEKLRRYRFAFPSGEEQRVIASFLDHETVKIDALVAEAERAIALLQERRTSLISAAVTGQIDVRSIDAKSTCRTGEEI